MPVNSQHPDYAEALPTWEALRDAYDGARAVKARGETYLPKPGGMDDDDYVRYRQRAKWYGATERTVTGLVGMLERKPPSMQVPRLIEPHLSDITLTGVAFGAFAQTQLINLLLMGRYGIELDFTPDGTENPRPLWAGWRAEQIINWRTQRQGGQDVLTMVMLKEQVDVEQPDDPFTLDRLDQYRLLALQDGIYRHQTFQEVKSGPRGAVQAFRPVDAETIPLRREEPLDFIPFQFVGARSLTPQVHKAPLADLVELNYVNYRHSADYEHALYMTACPTTVITGHSDDQAQLRIGSMTAWIIPNAEAKVYWHEFKGSGLASHEKAHETDKQDMATMGARLLESQPGVAETFGAVALRHSGDEGMLHALARLSGTAIERCLRWHAWWHGATDDRDDARVTFSWVVDISTARLAAQDLDSLFKVWQGGAMSFESFYWNLQQGERVPPDRTLEEEQEAIEREGPQLAPVVPAFAGVNGNSGGDGEDED